MCNRMEAQKIIYLRQACSYFSLLTGTDLKGRGDCIFLAKATVQTSQWIFGAPQGRTVPQPPAVILVMVVQRCLVQYNPALKSDTIKGPERWLSG